MSGSSGNMGPTAQPYADNKMYRQDAGLAAGEAPPTAPPVTSAPPVTPPNVQALGSGQPGGPGGLFYQPRPWLGVPYSQGYGGQPAPFDNLHTQILNTLRMNDAGAGRFTANAAARYGYQGGTQQWRPDANPWGQPIQPYQWEPHNAFPVPPPPSSAPPVAPPTASAPPAAPKSAPATVDHTANFQQLMRDDPSGRLAYEYRLRNGDTMDWWQKNQLSLFNNDWNKVNQFTRDNSMISSNSAPLTMDEMRRLNTMAGIKSPF